MRRLLSLDPRRWRLPALAGLTLAVLGPRLADPNFGLFDDAVTLVVADRILGGDWSAALEASLGRLRPVHWLYHTLLRALGGDSALVFFLGNAALLLILALLIERLTHALTRSTAAGLLAASLFLLSGPVVENAYTLSKPELLQGVWILLALGLAGAAGVEGGRSIGLAILAAGAVALAALTKETAPLLVVIGSAWVGRAWLFRRLGAADDRFGDRQRRRFLLAAAIGSVFFVALQALAGSLPYLPQGYASGFDLLSAERLRENLGIWADWMLRDYLYLAFLYAPALWIGLRRKSWIRVGLLVDGVVWMGAWLALYLPWQFTAEYYLLPLALGAAMVAGVALTLLAQELAGGGRLERVLVGGSLTAGAVFLAATLPTNWTNARAQLAMDRANADLLTYVQTSLPEHSVLVLNIQEPNEFVTHFPTWVNRLLNRPDVLVDHIRFRDPAEVYGPGRPVFIASPVVENQFYPSVRLGVFEASAYAWGESLAAFGADLLRPRYQVVHRFRSLAIDTSCVFHPILGRYSLCDRPDMPIDTRRFGFGWEVFALVPHGG